MNFEHVSLAKSGSQIFRGKMVTDDLAASSDALRVPINGVLGNDILADFMVTPIHHQSSSERTIDFRFYVV